MERELIKEKAGKLYGNLLKAGYTEGNIGTEESFMNNLKDTAKAGKLYDNLIKSGLTEKNLGNKDSFMNNLYGPEDMGQTTEGPKKEKVANSGDNIKNLYGENGQMKTSADWLGEIGKPVNKAKEISNVNDRANTSFANVALAADKARKTDNFAEKPYEYTEEEKMQMDALGRESEEDEAYVRAKEDERANEMARYKELQMQTSIEDIDNKLREYEARNKEIYAEEKKKGEAKGYAMVQGSPMFGGTSYQPSYTKGNEEYEANTAAINALVVQKDFLKKMQQYESYDNAEQGKKNGFIKGLLKTGNVADFATLGLSEIVQDAAFLNILKRSASGERLTIEEQRAVNMYSNLQEMQNKKRGFGFTAGMGLQNTLKFMTQLAVTGGVGGAGLKGALAATKLSAKLGGRSVAMAVTKKISKELGKSAVRDLMFTPFMPSTTRDFLDREIQDYDLDYDYRTGELVASRSDEASRMRNIYKALASNWTERWTESIGNITESAVGLAKVCNNTAAKGVIARSLAKMGKISKNPVYRQTSDILEKIGINSIPGEMFEEIINVPLQSVFLWENQFDQLADPRFYGEIALTSCLLAGMGTTISYTAQGASNVADWNRARKRYNNAESIAEKAFLSVGDTELYAKYGELKHALTDPKSLTEEGKIDESYIAQVIEDIRSDVSEKGLDALKKPLDDFIKIAAQRKGGLMAMEGYVTSTIGHEYKRPDGNVSVVTLAEDQMVDGKKPEYYVVNGNDAGLVLIDNEGNKKLVKESSIESNMTMNADDYVSQFFFEHLYGLQDERMAYERQQSRSNENAVKIQVGENIYDVAGYEEGVFSAVDNEGNMIEVAEEQATPIFKEDIDQMEAQVAQQPMEETKPKVEEKAEQVPVENIEQPVEETPVEEAEPDFMNMNAEGAINALEQMGEYAPQFVEDNIQRAKTDLEKAKAIVPSGKSYNKVMEQVREKAAMVEDATRRLDKWNEISQAMNAKSEDKAAPQEEIKAEEKRLSPIAQMAKAIGADVEFVDTDSRMNGWTEDITEKVLDENGNEKAVTRKKIFINLNSKEATIATFGHELTHRLEGTEAYEQFKQAALKMLEAEGVDVKKRIGIVRGNYYKHFVELYMNRGMSNKEAQAKAKRLVTDNYVIEEMVADVAGRLFTDNAGKIYNDLFTHTDRQTARTIKDIIIDILNKIKEMFGAGTNEYAMADNAIKAWENAYAQSAKLDDVIAKGEEIVEDGKVIVERTKDNSIRFNVYTEENLKVAREKFVKKMIKDKLITKEQGEGMIEAMDEMVNLAKTIEEDVPSLKDWNMVSVELNEKGKPIFTVVIPNSDYGLNIDFSLVCKKRRALDYVINKMVAMGVIGNLPNHPELIAEINDIIRAHGLETACKLCYVEGTRTRVFEIADNFSDMFNGILDSMIPAGSDIYVNDFNFGDVIEEEEEHTGRALETIPDSELNLSFVKELAEKKRIRNDHPLYNILTTDADRKKHKGEEYTTLSKNSVAVKIAELLLKNPARRMHTQRADFSGSHSFENLKRRGQDILTLYNKKKGISGPKASIGDKPYNGEVLNRRAFNRAKAFAVGGVRLQSFSDFVGRMWFDYVQLFADLSLKGLPLHTYTKEETFVRMFGMTGAMINMSLVPAVDKSLGKENVGLDANGNYLWEINRGGKDESFDDKLAFLLRELPGYAPYVGTIAVGVSDKQIRIMLMDDRIDMVIPFHKSNMPVHVEAHNNIDWFTDYTNFQNTRKIEDGKIVQLTKEEKKKEPNVNKLIYTGKAKNMHEAVEMYLDWCEENNYIPKFAQFCYELNEDGTIKRGTDGKPLKADTYNYYYKTIADFKSYYTDANGNRIPTKQEAVKMKFPKDFADVAKRASKEYDQQVADIEEKSPSIIDEILEKLGPKFSLYEETDEIISQAKANDTYLKAPNGKDTNLSPEQWAQVRTNAFKEWFGDWENNPEESSKVVDKNGEPMVVYHQTNSTEWVNRETGEKFDELDWQQRDYWNDEATQEEWEDNWEERDFYTFDNRNRGRQSVEMPAIFFSPTYDENHEYGERTIAAYLNIKNPAINPDIENAGVTNTAGKDAMEKLESEGYDGFMRIYDGVVEEVNAFNSNQVKSATENVGTFSAENNDIRFSIGDARKKQMRKGLLTKLTNATSEQVESTITEIEKLGEANPKGKSGNNPKLEKAAFHWAKLGAVILPEDNDKILQAVELAERKKVDVMQYKSPMEIINQFAQSVEDNRRIDPDSVRTLSNKKTLGHGITIYNVEESEESRENMRKIINTHFGKKCSPWCLLQGDDEGTLTSESKRYWNHYNKYPKRVAFQDGKLLAFFASDSTPTWWDRQDSPHSGIPVQGSIDEEIKSLLLSKNPDLDTKGIVGTFEYDESTGKSGVMTDIHRGNKTNGLYERWDDNGQLKERVNYKNGEEDGLSESWGSNGQLRSRANYKNGEFDGLSEFWHDNGQLWERQNYKDGELDGLYEQWYDNGQLGHRVNYKNGRRNGLQESWYKNGQLSDRVNYKNGERDGLYEEWYSNEQLSDRVNYKNGERDGLYEKWYTNGQLLSSVNYKDGVKDGLFERWYDNGQLQERVNYKDGEKDGLSEEWYDNGQLHERTNLKNGKLDGLYELWYENGQLEIRVNYEDDVMVSSTKEEMNKLSSEMAKKSAELDAKENVKFSLNANDSNPINREVKTLADNLNTPTIVVNNIDDIVDDNASVQQRKRKSKGWYDELTDELVMVAPNIKDANEAKAVFLRETVARKGMRRLFGGDYDKFCIDVFNTLDPKIQKQLMDKYGNRIIAGEKFSSSIAVKGCEPNLWNKIKAFFKEMLGRKGMNMDISDEDIKYQLWKSDNRQTPYDTPTKNIAMAEKDANVQRELFGKVRFSLPNGYTTNRLKLNLYDKFKEQVIDNLQSVRILQSEIERRGIKLDGTDDIYENAMLESSRAQAEYDKFDRDRFTPMIDKIAEIMELLDKAGLTAEPNKYKVVTDFLYARHAVERNRYLSIRFVMDILKSSLTPSQQTMLDNHADVLPFLKAYIESVYDGTPMSVAQVNNTVNTITGGDAKAREFITRMLVKQHKAFMALKKRGTNFSGMEDKHAKGIIDKFYNNASAEMRTQWDELQTLVGDVTGYTLRKWYDSGMISEDEYNTMNGMYKYYIPLRGWDEKEDIDYSIGSSYRGGSDITGMNKKAKGRQSLAEDPIAHMANMAQAAITTGHKNAVRQCAYRLCEQYGNQIKDLMIVEDMTTVDEYGNKIPIDDTYGWHKTPAQLKKHQINVFVDGQRKIITFKGKIGEKIAPAIEGTNTRKPPRFIGNATRFISAGFTSANPYFMFKNQIRDFLHGMSINIMQYGFKDTADLSSNYVQSFSAINRNFWNKEAKTAHGKKMDKLYQQFKEDGGLTGYSHIEDMRKIQKDIERRILRTKDGNIVNLTARGAAKILSGTMEWMGDMSENAMRFAAYKTAIESGMSRQDAAMRAKEITVNFNRKGAFSSVLGSLYVFFNASTQGTYNILRTMKQNPKAATAMITGMILLGFFNDMINGGDDDEEDEGIDNAYDRLSEYHKQTNYVMPLSNGEYLNIPYAPGFRIFTNIGLQMAQVMKGKKDVEDALSETFTYGMGDLLPFDIDVVDFSAKNPLATGFQPIVPSAIRPWYEVSINKNFMGLPIHKESAFNSNTPQYKLANRNASQLLVDASKKLNELTGGTEYRAAGLRVKDGRVSKSTIGNILDFNPSNVEHMVTGIVGGRFRFPKDVLNVVTLAAKGEKIEPDQIDFINMFIKTPSQKPGYREYYNLRNEVKDINDILNKMEKANDYSEENIKLMSNPYNHEMIALYETYSKLIDSTNDVAAMVDGDKKKELEKMRDALVRECGIMYRQIVKKYKNEKDK